MSIHDTRRIRIASDFSEDEILQAIETYCNGAFYPKRGVVLSRITRISEHETGRFGELVSAAPFYFAYRASSFIPQKSESKIASDRSDIRYDGDSFCFPVTIDPESLEYTQHNALSILSDKCNAAWYAAPLFVRRKNFTLLRNADRTGEILDDEHETLTPKGSSAGMTPLDHFAVVIPHTHIEKNETRQYYSYNAKGETAFHGEKAEKIKQDQVHARDAIKFIIGSKTQSRDLTAWADEVIELLPDLFGQTSGSRKLKSVIENALFEQIDENETASTHSTHKIIDGLALHGKLSLIEKILRRHFGIVQYFRFEFRG
jgi:hypothetical protein